VQIPSLTSISPIAGMQKGYRRNVELVNRPPLEFS
jgi:hypothetical protein